MRNIFSTLFDDVVVPLLGDAYVVEPDQHIEISLDDESLHYFVIYPSGLAKECDRSDKVNRELKRWVKDEERIEEIVRYATNWRRTAFFPHTGRQYIIFPDGRICFGGLGNHQ